MGAAKVVLDTWVEQVAPPSETARDETLRAAQRDGWPDDAVPVAERLLAFTLDRLAPELVPNWEGIVSSEDPDERLAALRAERSAYRSDYSNDEGRFLVAFMLDNLIEAIRNTLKARRLLDGPEEAWGSSQPLALARTVGRRCGVVLCMCDPGVAAPLLEELP